MFLTTRKFCLAALPLMALVDLAALCQASPVTFAFTGIVENVFDGLGALGDSVHRGAEFKGRYTFVSETPNTAPPVGEGEAGLYHHDMPPAGVRLVVGDILFQSVPTQPSFDIVVNNDFGFVGADEYGFFSYNNEAHGLRPSPPIGGLLIQWFASTFKNNVFSSAELPTTPPDLDLLGSGLLTVYGECELCVGPAAFFRIEGALTSLERAEPLTGDMDCDGDVDHDDIRPFILALNDPAAYERRFGVPPELKGDTDSDHDHDFDDIAGFVELLRMPDTGANQPVPEPPSLALQVLGLLWPLGAYFRRPRSGK